MSWFYQIWKKKLFFVLGVVHGDPILAQVGLKNDNFKRFQEIFQNQWIPIKVFSIKIEFPNIFHWKPAKKSKWVWCRGKIWAKSGPILRNKIKKQALSLGFFHILLGEYLLKQKVVIVKPPEWKFMAIIVKSTKSLKFWTSKNF